MKRIITCLLFSVVSLGIYAQFSDGYYRLQCKETKRYLAVHNNYVDTKSAKGSGQVELHSLATIDGFNNIVNDPGSVIYLRNTSSGIAIEAQGFTTANKNLNLNLIPVDDAYRMEVKITHEGVNYAFRLRDYEEKDGESYITTDPNKSTNQHWYVIPLEDDDNYFGLKGDVKVGNSYFTTIYAAFPIKLGNGMKAYSVNTLTESTSTLKDIGKIVPSKTPVLIECAGKSADENKVTPLETDDTAISDNKLGGVIFCYPVILAGKERRNSPYWNVKDYDPETMRILGEDDGKLCFIAESKEDYPYLAANRAYLPVASGSAASISIDGTTAIKAVKNAAAVQQQGMYTLSGVRLSKNAKPQKGIYIKDGKKIIIK